MKTKPFLCAVLISSISLTLNAQSFKDKLKAKIPKKDNSAIYECGYVHKPSITEKLNPMKALQKGIAGSVTEGGNSDLGKAAISVFYQANLHPQSIMKYPTKTPGWETCGDAIFAGFTNKIGLGLSSTDGDFLVDQVKVEPAGAGTFFYGFKPTERGERNVTITSSNGNKVEVKVKPAAPLSIVSIDGKPKSEDIAIDGTKDVIIELENGDADPNSDIHIQLICKMVGTPIIYDIFVTKAKNRIVVPKEAFKNFEGHASFLSKKNTLIVNRVVERLIDGTDAGALQTISAYMDCMPVTVEGDLNKGNLMTAGFDSTKNVQYSIDLITNGEYDFKVQKGAPYTCPPLSLMKKVAFGSFVVKGKLKDKTRDGDWLITKWFPEFSNSDWQRLTNKLYDEFSMNFSSEMGVEVVDIHQVVSSEAYAYTKNVQNNASKDYTEFGAYGSQRILTSTNSDFGKDKSISFPGDFVSERIIKELGVDAVLAVNVDLKIDMESGALNPSFSIVAFAPNVSYKTSAKYFSMKASTEAISLNESAKQSGTIVELMYNMIKASDFNSGCTEAMKELKEKEKAYPVYESLWNAKL